MDIPIDPTLDVRPRQFRELNRFVSTMLDLCKKVSAPRLYGAQLAVDLATAVRLVEDSQDALKAGMITASRPAVFAYFQDLKSNYLNDTSKTPTVFARGIVWEIFEFSQAPLPSTAAVAIACIRLRTTQPILPRDHEIIAAVKTADEDIRWAHEFSLSVPALQLAGLGTPAVTLFAQALRWREKSDADADRHSR